MKRRDPNFTKQGVRNLDKLPGKSKGVRLPEPPKASQVCLHPWVETTEYGDTVCRSCKKQWDWTGHPYD